MTFTPPPTLGVPEGHLCQLAPCSEQSPGLDGTGLCLPTASSRDILSSSACDWLVCQQKSQSVLGSGLALPTSLRAEKVKKASPMLAMNCTSNVFPGTWSVLRRLT